MLGSAPSGHTQKGHSPAHRSDTGRMLEMVTSGSFSSILSTPQVVSESQWEPKLSPREKGLSLYLG